MVTLSPKLEIPIDVVTETIAVLGIRGSGKTNTCVVMTEELLDAGQQVVVIDPTDAWWGLRSSKDGSRGAYPIVVFGGRHGDVPLSAGDGALVADAIVDNRIPAILSLRHFESQADQRRLVTDFARRIYHRKGEEGRETPMLLVIDEAHLFCPQRVGAAEAQMVGAIQKIVRQGRSSGLGVALIDQRAASVNKDLLTQLELLVCHRTSSPQDRKALEAWIEQHDTNDNKGAFLARLPALERGTAWFWSPGWLDLFKEVHVRERRTFDSSATPKAGERAISPTKLADVDLDALRAKLATSIEQSKADDPKVLRARIAELERSARVGVANAPTKTIEVSVLSTEDITVLENYLESLAREEEEWTARIEQMRLVVAPIGEWATKVRDAIARVKDSGRGALVGASTPRSNSSNAGEVREAATVHGVRKEVSRSQRDGGERPASSSGALGSCAARILAVIAQHDPKPVPRRRVAMLAGYSPTKSTLRGGLAELRASGLIEDLPDDMLRATRSGIAQAPSFRLPKEGDELFEWYLGQVGKCGAALMTALRDAGGTCDRDALGRRSKIDPTVSTFRGGMAELRGLGIADGKDTIVLASELVG
jgi:hypothetical protein